MDRRRYPDAAYDVQAEARRRKAGSANDNEEGGAGGIESFQPGEEISHCLLGKAIGLSNEEGIARLEAGLWQEARPRGIERAIRTVTRMVADHRMAFLDSGVAVQSIEKAFIPVVVSGKRA